ncbi:type II toxin-antitoxin system RelE/ParE family toxin [Salinimicrobium sp. 3283s]|uniref:type II toxin-antitoxin system RelE/ParE family toxin n=1 Tax=Salinimicrobium sp. 3283s TaxID=3114359 RepID=UPI0031E81F0E
MKSGYSIQWTSHALSELAETIDYLQKNWTDRELKSFSQELDNTLQLISKNPELFPASKSRKSIRRVVVAKYNSLYYRINKDSVEILSFFSNRQDPGKIKI